MRDHHKNRLRFILFSMYALLSLWPFAASTIELEAQNDGLVEKTNIQTPPFSENAPTTLYWQKQIQKIGSHYLRLHLSDIQGLCDNQGILELRTRSGRLVHEYPGGDLIKRKSFWTVVIPGDYVLISLYAPSAPVDFSFIIDQIAYQAYSGAPLSTWGEDDKEPIADYADDPLVSAVERSVARLYFIENGKSSTCTGFLIDSGQLITNHHCVNTQEVCETAIAVFGYQYDTNGLLNFGEQFECAQMVPGKHSYELDYTILGLSGTPWTKWGSLGLQLADPEIGAPLFIVQHPGGLPKQISKIDCKALAVPIDGRAEKTDFTHTCDTVGGSSGSPVFNESGQVVGLHHYGFGESGDWQENRAIRINRIIEHLESGTNP